MSAAHPYGKRRDKSGTLIGKDGRRYQNKIDEFMSHISDPAEKIQAKVAIANAHKNKERLTIRSLRSKLAETKAEKFLINTGYTRKEFEKEYGFSFDEFIDEDNWIEIDDKRQFVKNGIVYSLIFDYSGQILKREEYVR